jgi:ornithine cyclodeaminase
LSTPAITREEDAVKFLSEEISASLIDHEIAYAATREALIAAAGDDVALFPVVLGHGSNPRNRFAVKSGATADLAGLKVGSTWPGNNEIGLPRHNSAILLFDQRIGRLEWVIEAGKVNAYRTAAADAVAVDALARPGAQLLAIFGAGHQALYECMAVARVRPLSEILVVARDSAKGHAFVAELARHQLKAGLADAQEACERADIIVTATPSRAPLFKADWIRPGTHIAGMGADAVGKQELPPTLFDRAALFCDLPVQATIIGEFQHVTGDTARITAIGAVLSGNAPGRRSDDEITIFDSSGIALQDLYTARHLIAAAHATGHRFD